MTVRIANITDDMTDSEKILELLVCIRTNLDSSSEIRHKTDTMSVRMQIALQLQMEAQVATAIMYATDKVENEQNPPDLMDADEN